MLFTNRKSSNFDYTLSKPLFSSHNKVKVKLKQSNINIKNVSNYPNKKKQETGTNNVVIVLNEIHYPTNHIDTNIIPKYIFQTWKNNKMPIGMKNNIMMLRKNNPEFEFFLYDDQMCRNFIQRHFGPNEVYAFDSLIPGAFKADLWRYCVLYIYGGIYMDIKLQTVNGFKLIDLIHEECFPVDIMYLNKYYGIWQGFLICKPGNPILKQCIEQIIINVKRCYYGESTLSVTGPGLMYNVIYKYNLNYYNESKVKLMKINNSYQRNEVGLYYKNRLIIYFYKKYNNERFKNGEKHYSEFWNNKKIYNIIFNPIIYQINPTINTIPKYVFQTYSSIRITNKMKNNIMMLRKNNPEFEFFLYDDQMCRNFIQRHFGPNEVYAFDSLIPGAFKADLWRYCVLYIYGGIYMDIKLQTVNGFKLIDLIHEECFPVDILNIPACWQGFLICKPGNPILKIAIDKIYSNVVNKIYPSEYLIPTLYISGPTLLGSILQQLDVNWANKSSIIHKRSSKDLMLKNNKIIMSEYKEYRDELNTNDKYHNLYYSKKVYAN